MAMAIDPICKMAVDIKTAKFVSSLGGKKTYFCSKHCKETFERQFAEKKSGMKKKALPIFSQAKSHAEHGENSEARPMHVNFSAEAGNGKAIFAISGMHCANCANTIEKAVRKVSGVYNANVNFASEKALVEFDPKNVSGSQIADAINATGYRVIDADVQLPAAHAHSSHDVSLEKKGAEFDLHAHAHAVEEKQMLFKLKIGAVLGALVMLGSFPEIFSFVPQVLQDQRILMILTIPIEFWVGKTFFEGYLEIPGGSRTVFTLKYEIPNLFSDGIYNLTVQKQLGESSIDFTVSTQKDNARVELLKDVEIQLEI